jgi:hypothetical protein
VDCGLRLSAATCDGKAKFHSPQSTARKSVDQHISILPVVLIPLPLSNPHHITYGTHLRYRRQTCGDLR